ncbi:unnamed protein product [Toxocara canis]|uniref:Serine/threonine protein kinase n=1 Tax=Toxocara canis TaxID=6265 RepID=A0A183UT19_TOXCA|nr:unnamed protein product [Toxocara canis]
MLEPRVAEYEVLRRMQKRTNAGLFPVARTALYGLKLSCLGGLWMPEFVTSDGGRPRMRELLSNISTTEDPMRH